MIKVFVDREETTEGFIRISDYLEETGNLSEGIAKDINEIQKINQPWVSKLNAEKIQKRIGLDGKQRGV